MIGIIGKYFYKQFTSYIQGKNRTPKKFFDEENKYLGIFDLPNSNIDYSYYQYQCQNFIRFSKCAVLILTSLSIVAIIPTVLFFCFMNVFLNSKTPRKGVVTYPSFLTNDVLPKSLREKYAPFGIMEKRFGILDVGDLKFIFDIFIKYPTSFFFLYKCIWMIAIYSYAIQKFHPQIIVCSAEYSFTSAVLTMYCEQKGIEHINIMHGEKRFNIRDAFSVFTKFYVWDEHYVKLFRELKCKANYIVSPPNIPEIVMDHTSEQFTYYLQLHDEMELKRIKHYLEKLGGKYMIRPHPIYSKLEVEEIFDKRCIENSSEVDIWESIARSKAVISQDSTVLFQAYLLHVPVIIDDVSNPDFFNDLKDRKYIMLNKPHRLLSSLI